TTPPPNTLQRRFTTFFAEQRMGWQLELSAETGFAFCFIFSIIGRIPQLLASS
ncbi:fructosamine kinase family protein, partial [Escherichia coli]